MNDEGKYDKARLIRYATTNGYTVTDVMNHADDIADSAGFVFYNIRENARDVMRTAVIEIIGGGGGG